VLVSVACNGRHNLKERLARWLLMMRDRSDDDVMPIGQSLLAEMLGVQRPYITHAIAGLEGVICQTTACSNVRVSGTKVGPGYRRAARRCSGSGSAIGSVI
jgi:hypothetical protein